MTPAPGLNVTPSVRLVRPFGAGGMGAVWIAEHLTLHTQVVVKFMSSELAKDPASIARFSREAAAAAAVKSPHVVQMFDHGIMEGGAPFIVMELLEGEDLGQRVTRLGALPVADVDKIVTQACKALGRAHAAGIVHRDIKPDNIFLCHQDDGDIFVKILDFGIAKKANGSEMGHTRTGALMGTPYYMSPEQALGLKNIDLRTDLWSLGVVAYECLTGVRPFEGETVGALSLAIVHGPMPVPSRVASVPGGIDEWFARACCREVAGRFASAKELADAFPRGPRLGITGGTADGRGAPPVHMALAPTAEAGALATTTSPTSTAEAAAGIPRKGRGPLIAVLGLLVVGLVAAGAVWRLKRSAEEPASATSASGASVLPSAAPSASASHAPESNRWVTVQGVTGPVYLGVASERSSDVGFRPSRHIAAPKQAYDIQQHEVTWGEIDPFLTTQPDLQVTAPDWVPRATEQRKGYPATNVPWAGALEYCKSLGGSLPTEEQWELAARGPDLRPNPWGSDGIDLFRTVAYRAKSAHLAMVMTSDQDQTPGSPPIYDMAGNALEWTEDLYRDDRPGQPEGWAQEGGLTYRAVRGLPPADAQPKTLPTTIAAYRQALCATGPCPKDTAKTLQWVGFRCVRRPPT
jgi:serine/threonine-protein kinase